MFLWTRAEARNDARHMDTNARHMDAKLDANRELIRAVHEESKNIQISILHEIKDFHGRLCTIEERRLKG